MTRETSPSEIPAIAIHVVAGAESHEPAPSDSSGGSDAAPPAAATGSFRDPASLEDLTHAFDGMIVAFRRSDGEAYRAHREDTIRTFGRVISRPPDRCRNCGRITFLNPEWCCTGTCAAQLSLRGPT